MIEKDISIEAESALSEYGQFYSYISDFEFLLRLRSGRATKSERDEWFHKNSGRRVWHLAQGILAAVYSEDPP